MAKKLLLLTVLLAKLGFAQGNIYNDIAIGNAGIPGATIRVCSASAAGNIGSCSPLASVYTDATLATACDGISTTCSNPFTADTRGNYSFYAAPGRYVIDISAIGFSSYRQTVAVAIDPNGQVNLGSYMRLGVVPFGNLNPSAVDGTIVGVSGASATSPCSSGTATLVARHEQGQWNCSGSSGGGGGGNSVTAVTATGPITSTGGPTPNIAMAAHGPGQSALGPCAYTASSANPTVRALCIQDVPPSIVQAADNVLFSGPSDANGNPNFLGTTAGLAVLINPTGLPTPAALTSFINGKFQSITQNANWSVAVPTLPVGEFFVLQNLDTSSDGTVVQGDIAVTNIAPQWSYPPAPTCDANASATWTNATNKGPHYWFNMASQTMFRCTASANGFTISPAAMLGVCDDSGSVVDKCVAEPYGLTPGRRYFLFGDGANGVLSLASGATTTQDGSFSYRSCFINAGSALRSSNPTVLLNTPGLLLYCQTPLLVMGSSSIGVAGGGRLGSAGVTGPGVVGQNGGMGGGGGGSGGASTTNTTGAAGGGQTPFWTPQSSALIAGGTAGVFGGAAPTVGKDVTVGWVGGGSNPFIRDIAGAFLFGFGAAGAAGSGNGTLASGAGGNGGSFIIIKAPSILLDTGSNINCSGSAGGNSGNASGGGGGGGGGWCIAFAGFSTNGATGITAAGGAGGTSGTGQAGAAGGAGITAFVRAF